MNLILTTDEALRHNEVKSLAAGQALARHRITVGAGLELQTSYG